MSLTPPQNYLVEEILLGCILINPLIFSKVIDNVKIESFFLESHQLIYINILKIYYKNKLHPIELLYSLSDHNNLKQIGGVKKILELMKQSQIFIYSNNTNIYLNQLIEVINNNYTKRLIVQYGYNIVQLSYNKKMNGYILYNKASHYLNITVDKMPRHYKHNLKELMRNAIYDIKSNHKENVTNKCGKKNIIKSGFTDLDQLTYGLPFGDLIILAGRPSMGKTSLAINIAYNILQKAIYSICIFSLEMSSKQILNKFLSISSNIPYNNLINSHLYHNKWKKIKEACKKLLNSNIYIYDQSNVSIDYIEYLSKIWIKENNNIGIIIIDYLQLIQTEYLINLQRVQQLSYITRKLKMLAQSLDVPILTLSQLNRSIETRVNKEPILSDLKESGCINKDICIEAKTLQSNNIYIKSMIKYSKLTNWNHDILKLISAKTNYITSITIMNEHLFNLILPQFHIQLTHNHKCLNINQWSTINQFTENHSFTILKYKNKIAKQSVLQYSKLVSFQYTIYNVVYDLTMMYYTYFICNDTILHNSIEQDADIIVMLYDKKEHFNNVSANTKIIDLVISKNRHGPIGSCQLVFSKENTSFTNI